MSNRRTKNRRARERSENHGEKRLIYRKAWVTNEDGTRIAAIETEYGFAPYQTEEIRDMAFERRFLGMAFPESDWVKVERDG
jgi:hypothetical protein